MAVEYKCENCMASLRFDAASGKLVCDFCGSSFTTAYMDKKMASNGEMTQEEFDSIEEVASPEDKPSEQEEVKDISSEEKVKYNVQGNVTKIRVASRKCPSCGADILGDGRNMATFCAFCGNSELSDTVSVDARTPDMILPFRITKERAMSELKAWGSKGFVTPRDFTSTSTAEKITGMYVPFFLFDVTTECDFTGVGEKVYTRRFFGREWEITEYWKLRRKVKNSYVRIPADASVNMDDTVMDKLEPFDYADLKDFQMSYMSGFLADNYTVEDSNLAGRIASRVKDYSLDAARDTVQGYSSLSTSTVDYSFEWAKAKYVMLPVWILNYKYNDKMYEFAMNGQTGRVVGERPVSTGRAALLAAIVFAIAYVASIIVGIWFTGPFIFLLGLLIAGLIAFLVTRSKIKNQNTSMAAGRSDYQRGETIILDSSDKFIRKTRRRIDK